MLLQTGPRFTVPFASTTGLGLLLVLGAVVVYRRFADGDSVDPLAARGAAVALAGFGLGLAAIAFDFAGTMAGLTTTAGGDDPGMEPTLIGEIGLAAPWEEIALALFLIGVGAAVVGVGAAVRAELASDP